MQAYVRQAEINFLAGRPPMNPHSQQLSRKANKKFVRAKVEIL